MSIIAKVEVTLSVDSGSCWGEDCPISQIRKQALEGVRNKLDKLLKDHTDIKIIGTKKVVAMEYDIGVIK